jgi:hypothetical protein
MTKRKGAQSLRAEHASWAKFAKEAAVSQEPTSPVGITAPKARSRVSLLDLTRQERGLSLLDIVMPSLLDSVARRARSPKIVRQK